MEKTLLVKGRNIIVKQPIETHHPSSSSLVERCNERREGMSLNAQYQVYSLYIINKSGGLIYHAVCATT